MQAQALQRAVDVQNSPYSQIKSQGKDRNHFYIKT